MAKKITRHIQSSITMKLSYSQFLEALGIPTGWKRTPHDISFEVSEGHPGTLNRKIVIPKSSEITISYQESTRDVKIAGEDLQKVQET